MTTSSRIKCSFYKIKLKRQVNRCSKDFACNRISSMSWEEIGFLNITPGPPFFPISIIAQQHWFEPETDAKLPPSICNVTNILSFYFCNLSTQSLFVLGVFVVCINKSVCCVNSHQKVMHLQFIHLDALLGSCDNMHFKL